MPIFIAQMLFIRNLAVATDTNEGNQTPEDAGLVNGTYYPSSGDIHRVDVTLNDVEGDNMISDNHNLGASDSVSYSITQGSAAGTSYSGQPDVTFLSDIVIKTNGGVFTNTTAEVVQMENGDIFLVDTPGNSIIAGLDLSNIETIKITRGASANTTATDGFSVSQAMLCFATGTLIETDKGTVPVQSLRVSDMVRTLDNGVQPITWIEEFCSSGAASDALIDIPPGALGPDVPNAHLRLTKNHRVMLRSKVAERLFGTSEVFVYAKALTTMDEVTAEPEGKQTPYFHIGCAAHEIVLADGAPCETAYFGPVARRTRPSAWSPSLKVLMGLDNYDLARPCPKLPQQEMLIRRINKNRKSLFERHAKPPEGPGDRSGQRFGKRVKPAARAGAPLPYVEHSGKVGFAP